MVSFTLDTNCVIAVEADDPEAPAIRDLAEAHSAGKADVAVVAIMASEKQKSGATLESFEIFKNRLISLGLGHLGLCLPPLYFGLTFLGFSLWGSEEAIRLDASIHRILFPNIHPSLNDFCAERGLSSDVDIANRHKATWRNAKCDVLAILSHIIARRDVFVSNDKNFHSTAKKAKLLEIGAGRIEYPDAARALLQRTS